MDFLFYYCPIDLTSIPLLSGLLSFILWIVLDFSGFFDVSELLFTMFSGFFLPNDYWYLFCAFIPLIASWISFDLLICFMTLVLLLF